MIGDLWRGLCDRMDTSIPPGVILFALIACILLAPFVPQMGAVAVSILVVLIASHGRLP